MPDVPSHPRRLRSYVIPHRRAILWGVFLSLFTVAFCVGIPFISRQVIDGLTAGTLARRELWAWLGAYGAATLVSTALSFWMRQLPLRVGHAVETCIRGDLFDHLTRLDRGFFRAQQVVYGFPDELLTFGSDEYLECTIESKIASFPVLDVNRQGDGLDQILDETQLF